MTKNRSTKTAFVFSAFTMLLSVAMLVGSTFAWFTDTASTGINKITSGNLDVEIQDANGEKIDKLEWQTPDGRKQDDILWEPGCTYMLTPFKIANTGTLALRYKLIVTGLDGDSELLDVIHFTYKVGDEVLDLNKEGHLAANGGETGMITVLASMDPQAGNEYQNKTLDNVKFTVYATQDTVENDSYGNQYDRYAGYTPSDDVYTVTEYNALKKALASGGHIMINEYIEIRDNNTSLKDRLTIRCPSELNLNSPLLVAGTLEESENWAALFINADTVINASQSGHIYCLNKQGTQGGDPGPYVAHIDGENVIVTVNGGVYHGGRTAFNVQNGTLVINGGTFQVTPDKDTGDCRYLLDCNDESYKNGTARIIVKGGTFVNFDPSNNPEGEGTSYVADGYKVVSEMQTNGDIWYTVVAE